MLGLRRRTRLKDALYGLTGRRRAAAYVGRARACTTGPHGSPSTARAPCRAGTGTQAVVPGRAFPVLGRAGCRAAPRAGPFWTSIDVCFRLGELGWVGLEVWKSVKTRPFYGPERFYAKKWRFSA
jgi:hypothetical protein